jgi:hypothetical protein
MMFFFFPARFKLQKVRMKQRINFRPGRFYITAWDRMLDSPLEFGYSGETSFCMSPKDCRSVNLYKRQARMLLPESSRQQRPVGRLVL